MPDARQAEILSKYTSAFVSPFTDMPPVAFYSSLTIPRTMDAADCLPCSLRGITRDRLALFLNQLSSVQVNSALLPPALSITKPTIPPQPTLPL